MIREGSSDPLRISSGRSPLLRVATGKREVTIAFPDSRAGRVRTEGMSRGNAQILGPSRSHRRALDRRDVVHLVGADHGGSVAALGLPARAPPPRREAAPRPGDRKSTRLNSSHSSISYAVF